MSGRRVIVVGGGPAGAATAWHLARAGREVLLLERSHHPREKACAEYLGPGAVRILATMGVLARLEGAGAVRLAGMTVRAPGGELIVGDFATSAANDAPAAGGGLAVRRTILDPILLEHAREAGTHVMEGARVCDVTLDARGTVNGVELLVDGQRRRLGADVVVAADGLRSVVARRLGLQLRSGIPHRMALVAHFRDVDGLGEYGEMHVEADGYCGLASVGNGDSVLSLVVPTSRAREIAGRPAAFMRDWIASRPQLAHRYRHARLAGRVLATGPFASRVRRVWAPGVALVGDAAGYFDPFTGEGMRAALHGSELLVPFLGAALDELDNPHGSATGQRRRAWQQLHEYGRTRRKRMRGGWAVERLVALAVAHPAIMNRAAASLASRRDLANLLVAVTGGTTPASAVLRPTFFHQLLVGPR